MKVSDVKTGATWVALWIFVVVVGGLGKRWLDPQPPDAFERARAELLEADNALRNGKPQRMIAILDEQLHRARLGLVTEGLTESATRECKETIASLEGRIAALKGVHVDELYKHLIPDHTSPTPQRAPDSSVDLRPSRGRYERLERNNTIPEEGLLTDRKAIPDITDDDETSTVSLTAFAERAATAAGVNARTTKAWTVEGTYAVRREQVVTGLGRASEVVSESLTPTDFRTFVQLPDKALTQVVTGALYDGRKHFVFSRAILGNKRYSRDDLSMDQEVQVGRFDEELIDYVPLRGQFMISDTSSYECRLLSRQVGNGIAMVVIEQKGRGGDHAKVVMPHDRESRLPEKPPFRPTRRLFFDEHSAILKRIEVDGIGRPYPVTVYSLEHHELIAGVLVARKLTVSKIVSSGATPTIASITTLNKVVFCDKHDPSVFTTR